MITITQYGFNLTTIMTFDQMNVTGAISGQSPRDSGICRISNGNQITFIKVASDGGDARRQQAPAKD